MVYFLSFSDLYVCMQIFEKLINNTYKEQKIMQKSSVYGSLPTRKFREYYLIFCNGLNK